MTQKILLNGSVLKILGVIYLNKKENWSLLKGDWHWVVACFTDTENLDMESHNFAFDIKANLSKNLAKFTFSLLDSEGKLIKLSNVDQKASQAHFIIDTLKMSKSEYQKLKQENLN